MSEENKELSEEIKELSAKLDSMVREFGRTFDMGLAVAIAGTRILLKQKIRLFLAN